jgi:hypothetical protein
MAGEQNATSIVPDFELLELCSAYTAARAEYDALWPPGYVDPDPPVQALIDAASDRMTELHRQICDQQPVTPAGRCAMAGVLLAHLDTDEDGEPVSDRDLPLMVLARAVLAEASG